MIILENVKKVFQTKNNEIVALDDVHLQIEQGEIFGVIGYSGAGKSTLIRLFNQLEKPTSGSIQVFDYDMNHLNKKELLKARREIGMIFQHFNLLWSRTVSENIEFPLEIAGIKKEIRKQRVAELLELVGLADKANAYPNELSGGQKQRVGIARALANNPKVLLCDEATSALDPETTDQILDLLVDINKRLGLTIILITHEMHVIQKICNRVAVMEAGKVIELGNVIDVFKNPKQPVTKRFIQQVRSMDETEHAIDHLINQYRSGKIVKFKFTGENVERPLLQQLFKVSNLYINILEAKIQHTPNGALGYLIAHVDGIEVVMEQAFETIAADGVEVEVIHHV